MSNGYEETRVIVDGALVENYAFELGDTSEEVARRYHATNAGKLIGDYLKLRELCADMLSELDAATQYDAGGGRGVVYELADRLRDLGVEV